MKRKLINDMPLHLMIIPGFILVLIYSYGPMLGIIIAFKKFIPAKGIFGSKWIGLDNFTYVMHVPGIYQIIFNTVFIAFMKIVVGIVAPIVIALMLNEIGKSGFKRSIQTIIYIPHFLSWVILGGVLIDILSPTSGLVNSLLSTFGIKPIYFLGDNHWFPYTLVATDLWKELGFSTIIYLAALTGIDPSIYEAAVVDGAGRWKQTWHVTLPSMISIIVLMATLSMGNILNAGFDQVFNLYNPQVYESGDIIDTFVYRLGLVDAQYGPATAVGLFKSVVSFLFISIAYTLAYRFANYRIF